MILEVAWVSLLRTVNSYLLSGKIHREDFLEVKFVLE